MNTDHFISDDDAWGQAQARGRAFKARLFDDHPWVELSEAAKRLGRDSGELKRLLESKALIGVDVDGKVLIPAAFIRERQPLPGLGAAIEAMQIESNWVQIAWFLTPNDRLSGRTPAEALPQDLDAVVMVARSLGIQGGA